MDMCTTHCNLKCVAPGVDTSQRFTRLPRLALLPVDLWPTTAAPARCSKQASCPSTCEDACKPSQHVHAARPAGQELREPAAALVDTGVNTHSSDMHMLRQGLQGKLRQPAIALADTGASHCCVTDASMYEVYLGVPQLALRAMARHACAAMHCTRTFSAGQSHQAAVRCRALKSTLQ